MVMVTVEEWGIDEVPARSNGDDNGGEFMQKYCAVNTLSCPRGIFEKLDSW
jgi:hypothetical protein